MHKLAKQIYEEMCPTQPHKFSEIPESRWWLLLLLRMGMDLYLAAEHESNVLVVQELKGWASDIPNLSSVEEALHNLEKASQEQPVTKEILPNLSGEKGVLIATALVELALKDAHMDEKELCYLNNLFEYLSPYEPSNHQNWLIGELPEDNYNLDTFLVEQSVNDLVAERIASHLLQKSKSHRKKSGDVHILHRQMQKVRLVLDTLRNDALLLGQEYSMIIDDAAKEIARLDHLRIAVLGEFKRGKSTIINAILQRPNFMPTDELPCTSAIIEIRHGTKDTYIEIDPVSGFQTDHSCETFLKNAGNADERGRKRARGDENTFSEQVSRWRVSLESPFFAKPEQITLIDTPGLNEDPIRDKLARIMHDPEGGQHFLSVFSKELWIFSKNSVCEKNKF